MTPRNGTELVFFDNRCVEVYDGKRTITLHAYEPFTGEGVDALVIDVLRSVAELWCRLGYYERHTNIERGSDPDDIYEVDYYIPRQFSEAAA